MKKLILLSFLVFAGCHIIAQTIVSTGSLAVVREYPQSQLLSNGKVLCFGGDDGNYLTLASLKSAELYDPTSGKWTSTGSLAVARSEFGSALLPNGNVLAIGGDTGDMTETNKCEIYNISTGKWSYTDTLNWPRFGFATVRLNSGKILIAGGMSTSNSCELYDPATSKWSNTGDLVVSRGRGLSMVLLSDGKVLATGGEDDALGTGEVYNPSNGKWNKITSNMIQVRDAHSSVLLDNGKVLIAGGSCFDCQTSSELFNPVDSTFTTTGDLQEGRVVCPMVKQTNGNVIVFGIGDLLNPTDNKCIELYNVTTGQWTANKYSNIGAESYTINKLLTGKILVIGGIFTTGNGATGNCWLITEGSNSINEDMSGINIKVFPNPASEKLFINIDGLKNNLPGNTKCIIMDLTGKTILITRLSIDNAIDIHSLTKGIYTYSVVTNNQIISAGEVIVN